MRIANLNGPQLREYWSLLEDVQVDRGQRPDETLVLRDARGPLHIPDPSALLREAVRRMTLGAVSLRNLLPSFPSYCDPPESVSDQARGLLRDLDQLSGVIARSLAMCAALELRLVPLNRGARLTPWTPPGCRSARLPPSAVTRHRKDHAELVCQGSGYRAEFRGDEAVRLLEQLNSGETDGGSALPEPVLAYLCAAGLLVCGAPRPCADSCRPT